MVTAHRTYIHFAHCSAILTRTRPLRPLQLLRHRSSEAAAGQCVCIFQRTAREVSETNTRGHLVAPPNRSSAASQRVSSGRLGSGRKATFAGGKFVRSSNFEFHL